MATIAEGWAGTGGGLLLGDQRRKLEESVQSMYRAYLEGPFVLPPDQLLAQLKEQDAALLTDLVHQLYWEHLGTPGYSLDLTAERGRAIDESRRLWKYNPLAQWMIWLHTNYGFGENIVITPEDEAAIEVWEEFWKADRNQAVLAQDRIADKLSNWLLVDGDRFLAFYASTLDGETTVRRINTKEIVEIVTDPDDSMTPLFYKRQWSTPDSRQRTMYYPDWEAFFVGEDVLKRAKLPRDAVRADQFRQWGENGPGRLTTVCILHVAFNGKDEDSLYGWPLLAAGSPWIRSQKRHLENRLAVSAAKAMYVRKATVKGGSRAVDAVIANLRTALSSTQSYETSPPAVAGSTLVENQAVTTTDLPMTTGASDAKTDGEMFSWMALLSGGVFPHWAGLGDAYRLATATSMEGPLLRQFSRYQVFWSAQFRKMARIVLQMKEKYGDATFRSYEAEVSTDKLVEVDLDGMSTALGRVFQTVINPQAELGAIPQEVVQGMLQATLRTVLQALGVDAEEVVGDEAWKVEGEEEIEEGGPGSGHHGHAGRLGKVGGSLPGKDGEPGGKGVGLGSKLKYKPDADIIKSAEQQAYDDIDYAADREGITRDAVIAEVEKRLEEDLKQPLAIRRGRRGAMNIAEEERFKTQFETGTSGGHFAPDVRKRAENRGLGIPTDIADTQRPIYAYFATDRHHASGYGAVEFVLKDSVKDRTTYTLGDSLQNFANWHLVGGTSAGEQAAWDRRISDYYRAERPSELGISYVEAQIQGGVKLSDVSKVVIHSSFGKRDYEDLISVLTTKGIKVEVVGADIVF